MNNRIARNKRFEATAGNSPSRRTRRSTKRCVRRNGAFELKKARRVTAIGSPSNRATSYADRPL